MAATSRPAPARCGTCNSDPEQRFGEFRECSHVSCPVRRCAWSDGTGSKVCAIDPDDELLDFMFDGEG